MSWREAYKEKIVSVEEAMEHIKEGDLIIPGDFCAEPVYLIDAMTKRAQEIGGKGIRIAHGGSVGPEPHLEPGMEKYIHFTCLCAVPKSRTALQECRVDFMPVYFHQWPKLFRTALKPNVALIEISEPDEKGFASLGVSCDYTCYLPEYADVVIAQVNKNMPYVDRNLVNMEKIDFVVPHDEPVVELTDSFAGEKEKAIAKNIVPLIHDGDCLQLGRGKLPDYVMTQLGDKKDLGIHSEMISDGALRLIRQGVITNSKKKFYQGQTVCAMLAGSADLYKWAEHNPELQLLPVDIVNDPKVIAQNDNVVSLNSALEVDLTGQIAADMIGPKQFTGVGGFTDFVRGASESNGGRTIVAFAATSSDGKHSRIVPHLTVGAAATATRYDVDYVVTEFGVAQLWGKTNRERVRELISIAHPDFREELTAYAYAQKMLWD
ncbi:MAG: acetyl-CoA hydrolase/transferase C-terminal domain-containing protein [Eubacteriales bacterium]|nr:acetyl-CoA hydrolase/transferase C-terminal domain-containing protein [Eubacteriales bacterium]